MNEGPLTHLYRGDSEVTLCDTWVETPLPMRDLLPPTSDRSVLCPDCLHERDAPWRPGLCLLLDALIEPC